MLKLLTQSNLFSASPTKCGEIFYHNFKDLTIFCTFCQMKSFNLDDFTQHLQSVHLENHLAEELDEYLQVNVKNEDKLNENKNILGDNKEQPLDSSEFQAESSSKEEEELMILKNSRRKRPVKRRKCSRVNQDINNDEKIKIDELGIQNKINLTKTKTLEDTEICTLYNQKTTKEAEYSCSECSAIYSQKKHLDQHVFELHNGYKCPLCDKRFRRSYHVASHAKTHTSEKKFTCSMKNCGRSFTEELYLKRHLEVHTMERNFICDYENCGKAFHTNRRLASHQFTHRIPKKFVCDMCGHSCRSNIELTIHQRVHTGEKPFPCEICSKPFKSKVALKEHMISHSESRPHVCGVCNASFTNRRVLVRHSFIHLEEKTFKCKLCESAFRHPNSLQGHMRNVHREPKKKHTKNLLKDL